MKCSSGKKAFVTLELAEDVLIETRTRFDYAPNYGPIAVYRCDDCGYYHLTSQGKMNEKLSKHLNDGTIKRQKEADRWKDKFKR